MTGYRVTILKALYDRPPLIRRGKVRDLLSYLSTIDLNEVASCVSESDGSYEIAYPKENSLLLVFRILRDNTKSTIEVIDIRAI
jgi:hypothetical protein